MKLYRTTSILRLRSDNFPPFDYKSPVWLVFSTCGLQQFISALHRSYLIDNTPNQLILLLTWLSLRPNFSASFFLSGLLMYFCIWNLLSNPFLCKSLKTARRIMPLRGLPLPLCAHGNVPGSGKTVDCVPDTGVDTENIMFIGDLRAVWMLYSTYLLGRVVACSAPATDGGWSGAC